MRRTFGLGPTRILAPASEVVDDVALTLARAPRIQAAGRARAKSMDFGYSGIGKIWPEAGGQRNEFEGISTENKGRMASVNPVKDLVHEYPSDEYGIYKPMSHVLMNHMLEYQTRRSRAHLSTYCPTFSFYLSSFSVRRRLRYVRHHLFIVHILMLAV